MFVVIKIKANMDFDHTKQHVVTQYNLLASFRLDVSNFTYTNIIGCVNGLLSINNGRTRNFRPNLNKGR